MDKKYGKKRNFKEQRLSTDRKDPKPDAQSENVNHAAKRFRWVRIRTGRI
jgi:hypothetical protein